MRAFNLSSPDALAVFWKYDMIVPSARVQKLTTTNHQQLFSRPKDPDDSHRQKSGTVYRISCIQCNFVYYGPTERSLKTRIAEHKKAVASFDQNSKVASHVHHFSHNMNFENVKVVGFEANYHERHSSKPGTLLFLWPLFTTLFPFLNTGRVRSDLNSKTIANH